MKNYYLKLNQENVIIKNNYYKNNLNSFICIYTLIK